MIDQLTGIAVPEWLIELSPTTMRKGRFPLNKLLRNSLYYPCSAFDGDPVKHLAGNVLSFVYADHGYGRDEFLAELENRGFDNYDPLSTPRSVEPQELRPAGVDWREPFYCIWSVFQRREGCDPNHGPSRFSLLYICGEAVETFRALYVETGVAPKAVAVIQPSSDIIKDPTGEFAKDVLQYNLGGRPEILLYGGYLECEAYPAACWPGYPMNLCFYRRYPYGGSRGCVGIWSRRPPSEG
ncbi:MAG: hypothetical protein OXE53_00030 [Deltaproteobacteria bacterium]|nr:hypothetical protein [Deltaproteobacteria bacterium]